MRRERTALGAIKHFVYIVRGESWVKGTEDYINWDFGANKNSNSPNYDECAWVYEKLTIQPPFDLPAKYDVFEKRCPGNTGIS